MNFSLPDDSYRPIPVKIAHTNQRRKPFAGQAEQAAKTSIIPSGYTKKLY
jgi:hypothetical protein